MIRVTEHDLREWSRCAQAMYRNGRNSFGHKLSAAAAVLQHGDNISAERFDELQSVYRAWLVFNEYPHLEQS